MNQLLAYKIDILLTKEHIASKAAIVYLQLG